MATNQDTEKLVDAILRSGGDPDGGHVVREWGLSGAGKGRVVATRFGVTILTTLASDGSHLRNIAAAVRGKSSAIRGVTVLDACDDVRDMLAAGYGCVCKDGPIVVSDDLPATRRLHGGTMFAVHSESKGTFWSSHAKVSQRGPVVAVSSADGWVRL